MFAGAGAGITDVRSATSVLSWRPLSVPSTKVKCLWHAGQQIQRFFGGFDLVAPGLVSPPKWRSEESSSIDSDTDTEWMYAGVGCLAVPRLGGGGHGQLVQDHQRRPRYNRRRIRTRTDGSGRHERGSAANRRRADADLVQARVARHGPLPGGVAAEALRRVFPLVPLIVASSWQCGKTWRFLPALMPGAGGRITLDEVRKEPLRWRQRHIRQMICNGSVIDRNSSGYSVPLSWRRMG